MKKWNFENIMLVLVVIVCAPILILAFGVYGFAKALFNNEDDERLCD